LIGRRAGGWIVAGAALAACAGCGFKGPLYLPERNATVVTHPGQPAPATKKKTKTAPPPAAPSQTPGGAAALPQ
jgi:predicted small lipoprotein YifL